MARISPSVLALLAANLVPLVGAAFFGWSVFDVFAVYWSENVIVGGFMILRLLTNPQLHAAARLGLSVFFTAHFGLFCFVHSVFLVAILGDQTAPSDFFAAPSHLLASAAGNAWGLGLIALAASHGVSFVSNYLLRERHSGQPNVFAPYARVVLMHVVLLAGAGLSFAIDGGGAVLLTLLVVAKVAADVMAHRAEHRQDPPTAQDGDSADGPEPDDESDYIAIE